MFSSYNPFPSWPSKAKVIHFSISSMYGNKTVREQLCDGLETSKTRSYNTYVEDWPADDLQEKKNTSKINEINKTLTGSSVTNDCEQSL